MRSQAYLHRRPRAFTLVEILLAIGIFGLMMIALAAVMRTGVRSWNAGHDLTELLQATRLTQDVLDRDLCNLIYIKETEYNGSYRQQLEMLAGRLSAELSSGDYYRKGGDVRKVLGISDYDRKRDQRRRDREKKQATTDEMLSLNNMTPPMDLTFHSTNGGHLDQFSFARGHQCRWEGDPLTGGVRRVTYYVKEGTLYRQESDPWGFRPGEQALEYYDNDRRAIGLISPLFFTSDLLGLDVDAPPDDADRLLPSSVRYEEPLCVGVEVFDLSFGFFKDGEWIETPDWDSGARRYRAPMDKEEDEDGLGRRPDGIRPGHDGTRPGQVDLTLPVGGAPTLTNPDDLPSYVRAKLGLRPPSGKGRVRVFTFTYAINQAQENDTLSDDERELRDEDKRHGHRVDRDRLHNRPYDPVRDRPRKKRSSRS